MAHRANLARWACADMVPQAPRRCRIHPLLSIPLKIRYICRISNAGTANSMKRAGFLIAGLVVLAAAGWQIYRHYWYYIPGLIAAIRDPIGPNNPVTWNQGPATPERSEGARLPNVLVILADDLGWNDLTFNGGGVAGGQVPTPNINSIGADGVTFTQAYAGDATCAPSRAAIMTGRYATRFGFEFTPAPVAFEKLISTFANGDLKPLYYEAREKDIPGSIDEETVPTSEITIAQAMKSRGYHTIMLGKWHLGGTKATRPEARGFDEALAFYPGASLYLPVGDSAGEESHQNFDPIDKFLWANLGFGIRYNGSKQFAPSRYMTDYLGAEAVRAIAANRNRPFFMYLAFNAPHTPLQAAKADYDALSQIADHRLRVYAAMIRALDRNVGQVLAALKDNGLADNTLVIFTSDNGGAHYIGLPEINKPFRGWKATFFEGGIHVPFFASWPAKLPKGIKFDPPIGHVDIFSDCGRRSGRRGSSRPRHRWRQSAALSQRPGPRAAAPDALLAGRRLQGIAGGLLETAGIRAAKARLAVQPEDRPNREKQPGRCHAGHGAQDQSCACRHRR